MNTVTVTDIAPRSRLVPLGLHRFLEELYMYATYRIF